MCKLWSKWFLFDAASPGAREQYELAIKRVNRQGKAYFYRGDMEVYSYCMCYDLGTIEQVNQWHHAFYPEKYGPDGSFENDSGPNDEVINISSDEDVIEISSDDEVVEVSSGEEEMDAMLLCDETISVMSDELPDYMSSASDDEQAPGDSN